MIRDVSDINEYSYEEDEYKESDTGFSVSAVIEDTRISHTFPKDSRWKEEIEGIERYKWHMMKKYEMIKNPEEA